MITVDETIVPGKYKLVLEGTEPPADGCQCDVQVGTVYGLPSGSEPIVVSRKVDNTIFLDFGIPAGADGESIKGDKGDTPIFQIGTVTTLPAGSQATVVQRGTSLNPILDFGIPKGADGMNSSGGSGSASLGRGRVSVMDFGAKGDGSNDDAVAFTNAWNAVRGTGGEVYIPYPDNYYNFKSTFNAIPDGSNQAWVDVKAVNQRAGKIRYSGPSGSPAIRIIGLKGAAWEGLHLASETGRNNVALIDISGNSGANSSSFNTFRNFYLNLGGDINQPVGSIGRNENTVGIRTGKDFPGDISNYNFENMIVFGGGRTTSAGADAIAGQHAFQNLGVNTLSMVWQGGFVAYCDRAYSNKAGSARGNGSVMFYGLGGSQNNIDFEFAWEQAYLVSGGRWEGGNKFCRISDGAYSSVVLQSLVVHDYKQDNQIEAQVATSLTLQGLQISKTFGGYYNSCVSLNAPRPAVLNMQNCAFSLAPSTQSPYVKSGSGQWDITAIGNVRLNGVWTDASHGFFPNEVGVRK